MGYERKIFMKNSLKGSILLNFNVCVKQNSSKLMFLYDDICYITIFSEKDNLGSYYERKVFTKEWLVLSC